MEVDVCVPCGFLLVHYRICPRAGLHWSREYLCFRGEMLLQGCELNRATTGCEVGSGVLVQLGEDFAEDSGIRLNFKAKS